MQLDFSTLQKAIQMLKRGIIRAVNTPQDEELRDAVIHRFEYTYELACKLLKKQLVNEAVNPETIAGLAFRDLLRETAQKGLIKNINAWFVYREQRNITSHTYDAEKAEAVRQTAYKFVKNAEELLMALTKRTP